MAKLNAEQTFRAKAPAIMAKLRSDFPIGVEDAAAILGNLGHESAGLTILQEIKPTVAGSRGGFVWAQWTSPRRRAYEAYCKRTGKDPASDDANYAYLFIELKGIEGSEKAAIGKTVAAKGLDAKVEAFELAFLRAGVKHYPSRNQ
ncbi:phage tail tip lysozyme [Devosia sp. 2618]|uniref:phage tail tip lysozyme n=1 Tax=Devosia sp. 2618 TaxID=3156454 RepID=UPI003399EE42